MKEKRICIVTNYSTTTNYGALLQAYALNQVITDLGYHPKELYAVNNKSSNGRKLIKQIVKFNLKSISARVRKSILNYKIRGQMAERKKVVDNFRFSIPHTKKYIVDNFEKLQDEFDIFICGSDQIFRPGKYTGELIEYFWLTMITEDAIKASYAASMGIDEFDKRLLDTVKEYLSSFNYISIREKKSASYISAVTGRNDVVTSIDPVFLLEREKWAGLEKIYSINGKYIFVYMIHGTKLLLASIQEFARMQNLKIVTFPSMAYVYRHYEASFGDYRIYNADPLQFIYLINHAEYVFTDSFHGSAFSFMFHKDVYVSKANGVAFSRIENIVNLFDLSALVIPAEGLSAEEYLVSRHIDWTKVDEIIFVERNKSIEYLKKVIGD